MSDCYPEFPEDCYYELGLLQYWDKEADYADYLKKGGEDGIEYLNSIYEKQQQLQSDNPLSKYDSQGSSFLIDSEGYLVTNYHVIEDAVEDNYKIDCLTHQNGELVSYNAVPIVYNKENDLAIIQIADVGFKPVHIPYCIDFNEFSTGTEVFTLGYPDIYDLGTEIKMTKGIISAKSGFKGDDREYQIDANIYGGNSGGPLFSENGSLIGINSASFVDNDNIHYSIKASVLNDLLGELEGKIILPVQNELDTLSLSQKKELIEPCVFLVGLYKE